MISIQVDRAAPLRIDWVDFAKGICIILVVMMHSTLGVEKATGQIGYLDSFIEWARPFRMPDFFLISGLFLARRIATPWRGYTDSKIIHFAYFYVLWMSIQFLVRGHGIYQDQGAAGVLHEYALGFIEPYGTLWFIYLLAVFFLVTRLTVRVTPLVMFLAAAALEACHIQTGWMLIDEFAGRFVYFYVGYWLAPSIFAYAERVRRWPLLLVLAALALWAAAEGVFVSMGLSKLPGISLALGLIGAGAVVAMGVVLARSKAAGFIRYLGANSIVVYLAFFLFMAATRVALLRFVPNLGVDLISLLVTAAGVLGPVLLHLAVRNTPFKFLFTRPGIARVETWSRDWHSAGHDKSKELRTTEAR